MPKAERNNRDELVKAPTSEETDQIIRKQINRSPGGGNIIPEMFIHAGLELKEELTD
jgi:hypothetical protein